MILRSGNLHSESTSFDKMLGITKSNNMEICKVSIFFAYFIVTEISLSFFQDAIRIITSCGKHYSYLVLGNIFSNIPTHQLPILALTYPLK